MCVLFRKGGDAKRYDGLLRGYLSLSGQIPDWKGGVPLMLEQLAKILVGERGKRIVDSMPYLSPFWKETFKEAFKEEQKKAIKEINQKQMK